MEYFDVKQGHLANHFSFHSYVPGILVLDRLVADLDTWNIDSGSPEEVQHLKCQHLEPLVVGNWDVHMFDATLQLLLSALYFFDERI